MGNRLVHMALASVPTLLTPGLFYLLAEGWLDVGGGEKDVLLVLPYFLWACIFFVVASILIVKRWLLRRWLLRSALISVSVVLALGVVVYFVSWL